MPTGDAAIGAVSVSAICLFLSPGVREHWMGWLQGARPDLVATYERLYGGASRLGAEYQRGISAIVRSVVAQSKTDTTRFTTESGSLR
jgi:hypothetical protein